mgnify:CR=1 FL=1|tara:strand:+ start:86 stop:1039 length:954 start_codon:yes stop_codon:yes gene_type:complete
MDLQNGIQHGSPEWHQARKIGIGASEVGAIIGVNPYKSALRVWAEKRGLVEPPDLSDNPNVQRGNDFEDVIATAWSQQHLQYYIDEGVYPDHPWGFLFNKSGVLIKAPPPHEFLLATPDYFIWDDETKESIPVEIKAPKRHSQVIPPQYEAQVRHQMWIMGASHGYLVEGLVENSAVVSLKTYVVDAESYEDTLLTLLDFWTKLQDGQMPLPDGSADSYRVLEELYPNEIKGSLITLPMEAIEIHESLQEINEELIQLQAKRELLRSYIKAYLGNAEGGRVPDTSSTYFWRVTSRKEYYVPESNKRQLRMKTLDEGE